jgi:hypothetical protein
MPPPTQPKPQPAPNPPPNDQCKNLTGGAITCISSH